MFKILIVEDDAELSHLFSHVLENEGYESVCASNGAEALEILDHQYIDLIVSDIMMPIMDGIAFLREIREAGIETPVLIITAKDSFQDMQTGFLSGGDDYMVKPINVNEMLLRVSALLRRSRMISERKLTVGKTVLEYDSLTVTSPEETMLLPQKEFQLLYKLLSYPNHIYTRQQLMDDIWGLDSETEARTVDVHINRLRDRFRNNEDFSIITVRGLGYKAVKNQ